LNAPTGYGFLATFGGVETAGLSRAVKGGVKSSGKIETVQIYPPLQEM